MAKKQILLPVILPLLCGGLVIQAVVPLVRVVTTYRALDLALGVEFVGLLSAVFALLPIFFAVSIGRFNDGGAVAVATVTGSICILVACVLLWALKPSLVMLLSATAVLGIGQTLCLSSMQLIAATSSSRSHRDSILGNYMVAMALGQAIGPVFLRLPVDGAAVLVIPVLGGFLLVVSAFVLLRAVPARRPASHRARVPLREITATRGLAWVVLTGSICVTAQDLLLAFMPVLGEERGLTPALVGLLLSARAIASMASRVLFSQAVQLLGRMRLLLTSVAIGGGGLLLLILPLPVWALAVVLMAGGFGIGLALTSSIALTLEIAPAAARGTALSLRLTANRITQFTVPMMAGLVLAPLGAAGILALIGMALIGTAIARPRGIGR